MTKEQETILILQGVISNLPHEEQRKCKELMTKIDDLLKQYNEETGVFVIGLIGATMQEKYK